MGAFLGYNDVGVWASNRERDAFLDWFAEHRCARSDARWEYCKSDAQRWTGRCIQLSELIPRGESFEVTPAERATAARKFWPEMGVLLEIISQITRGEWKHLISSKEAVNWRPADLEREGRWKKEEEELRREPFRSSSFGSDEHVKFLPRDDQTTKAGSATGRP